MGTGNRYWRAERERALRAGGGNRGRLLSATQGAAPIDGYVVKLQHTQTSDRLLVGHLDRRRLVPDAEIDGSQGDNLPMRGWRYQQLDSSGVPTGEQYTVSGDVEILDSGAIEFAIERGGARPR